MGGAVVAGKPGAVHAEKHRQLLQRHVVDDGIEGALQECRVDSAHRTEAARGHAGGEDDGVLLGDAHVEVALGMVRTEQVQARAVGHGGGYRNNPRILVGKLHQAGGKGLGIRGHADRTGIAGFRIVRPEAVEFFLPVERGLEAAALLREDVQQNGPVGGLEELEGLDELGDVVAVDGAVVLEAELFEHHGGPEHALGGFFGPAQHVDRGLAADLLHDLLGRVVQRLVVLVGDDAVEVAGDGADVAIDGPLIVVEDHDQAIGLLGDVVEGLEGDAVGKGGVAGDGDDVLRAARHVAGHRHAQSGRKRRAGVARAVAVVFALGAQGKAVEAAGLADGAQCAPAARSESCGCRPGG